MYVKEYPVSDQWDVFLPKVWVLLGATMIVICWSCGHNEKEAGKIGSDGLCDLCYKAIHDEGLAAVKRRGNLFGPAAKDLIKGFGMEHLLDDAHR